MLVNNAGVAAAGNVEDTSMADWTWLLDSFHSSRPDTHAKVSHWMETSGVSAEQVAEEIAKAVMKNKFLLLTHSQTRTAWRLKRWFPERYYKMLEKRSQATS